MKFLILLIALFSCNSKMIQIESGKTYEGSPDRQPIIIQTKYYNGREIEHKLINQRVKLIKRDIDTTIKYPVWYYLIGDKQT